MLGIDITPNYYTVMIKYRYGFLGTTVL